MSDGWKGASSGISNKQEPYGSEYLTIYQSGNIRFLKQNKGSVKVPIETMAKRKTYVTLRNDNEPKHISYYDFSFCKSNANKSAYL